MFNLYWSPHFWKIGKWSLEKLINLVGSADYSGIEVSVDETWVDWRKEEEISHLEDMLHQHDLSVPAVCWRPGPIDWVARKWKDVPGRHIADPRYINESFEYMKECLEFGKRLGAKDILVWPHVPEGFERSEAKKAVCTVLKRLRNECKSRQMKITYEFESEGEVVCRTHKDVLKLIQTVGDHVSICCDTYHMYNLGMDPYQSVLEQKGKIGAVHISDNNRLPPGKGKFNFKPFMRGLRDIRYEGPIYVQIDIRNESDVFDAYRHTRNLLSLLGAEKT